jgi:hypothetical protein
MPSSASIAGKAEPYSSKYHEEDEDEGCAVEAPGTSGRRGAARSVRVAAAAEPQPKIGSFFTKKEAAAAAKGEKREVKQEPKPEASPPSGKGVSGKRKGSGAPAAAGGAAKKTKGSPGKADKVPKDEQAASGASAGSDQRKLPRGKPKHRVGDKVLGMSVIRSANPAPDAKRETAGVLRPQVLVPLSVLLPGRPAAAWMARGGSRCPKSTPRPWACSRVLYGVRGAACPISTR